MNTKDNNGGVYATRGFEYQDNAVINAIFDYLNDKDFKGVRIEGENDFEIVETKEISGQVKSGVETLSAIGKEIISKLPDNKTEYLIYVSNLNNEAKNFITNLEHFKDEKAKLSDEEIIAKLGISQGNVSKARKCKFKVLPYSSMDIIVKGKISEWLADNRVYNTDIAEIYSNLLNLIRKGRSYRTFYSKADILSCIVKSRYRNNNGNTVDLINNLIGFQSDIIDEINSIINQESVMTNTDHLETLKLLIDANNRDALIEIDQLAEYNSKYNILRYAIHFLFKEYITDVDIKEGNSDFEKLVICLMLFKKGEYQESLNFAKKIDYKNVRTDLNFLIGLILYNLHEYKKAISYLEKDNDTDSKKSFALCLVFMCYKAQDPFYSDYTKLEEAQQLDANNNLAAILEVEYFVDNEMYEDALQLFSTLDLDKYTLKEKFRIYLPIIIAEQKLNNSQLHNDMINLLNVYKTIYPEKGAKFIYIGLDYTETFFIIFKNNSYYFVLGDKKVVITADKSRKVGLTVETTPVWKAINVMKYIMKESKISHRNFILKVGSPTLMMEVIPEELNTIINQSIIIPNHPDTYEYAINPSMLSTITNNVKVNLFFNSTNVKGDIVIGKYINSFIISNPGQGTFYFKKSLRNAKDFLVMLKLCQESYYITLPIECVHVIEN